MSIMRWRMLTIADSCTSKRSLSSFSGIDNGNVIGHNAELQVHHLSPQVLLKENGFDSEKINTFANYTIINKETNLDISAEEPAEYVKRLGIRRKEKINI